MARISGSRSTTNTCRGRRRAGRTVGLTSILMLMSSTTLLVGDEVTASDAPGAVTVEGHISAPTTTVTPRAGGLLVEWEPVTNAQKYRYRYREGAGPYSAITQVPLSAERRVVIDGLTDGAEYTVAVGTRRFDRWRNEWTEVTVTVGAPESSPNRPPEIALPPALVALIGTPTTISATVSDDGLPVDPGETASLWTLTSGPAAVDFTPPDRPITTVTFHELGTYLLDLTVQDGELETSATVSVEVRSEDEPAALVIRDYVDDVGLTGIPRNVSTFARPCVADLDEDGSVDILWSAHKVEPLNSYYGNPDGTFTRRYNIGLTKRDNHGCAVADFDRDGMLDIFGPNGSCQGTCLKRDSLWLQTKNRTFSDKSWRLGDPTLDRSRDSIATDINNDGWPDLVVTAAAKAGADSNHRIMMNRGQDSSGRWLGFETASLGLGPSSGNALCVGADDLDGDGFVEVMYCNDKPGHPDDGLHIYRNIDGAALEPVSLGVDGLGARGVKTSDVNADGWVDLLIAYDDRLEVRFNRSGDFSTLDFVYPLIDGHDIATPDIDGDGDLDVLVTQALSAQDPDGDGAHMLFLNLDGAGTTWARNPIPQPDRGCGCNAEIVKDFRHTGADAVLVGNGGSWDIKGPRQALAIDVG